MPFLSKHSTLQVHVHTANLYNKAKQETFIVRAPKFLS